MLEDVDVHCCPVLETQDAIVSEQALHNRVVQRLEGAEVDVVKLPIESD